MSNGDQGSEKTPGKVGIAGTGEFLEDITEAVEEAGGDTNTPGNVKSIADTVIEADIPESESVLDKKS